MKKILGIDLGVSSIGWAIVGENDSEKEILGMGCRIIPLSADDRDEFTRGNAISKNQKRTLKRTQRKGYDRYQLRRQALLKTLDEHNMLPDETAKNLQKLDLWKLRSEAVVRKITLSELGRVLLHLNQKRGYKSMRKDENADKKETEYVAEVKSRHEKLKDLKLTIGQFFYKELLSNEFFRIKQLVYPREAYIEEFDAICNYQKKHHPILIEDFISKLRNEIIYYQRKLKSQKALVSVCEFEGFWCNSNKNGKNKKVFAGPKVAPRTSPISQICKIWETVNNIELKNKNGNYYDIQAEEKKQIFEYLDNNEKLTFPELLKILNLRKDEGWYGNKQLTKGIQGNITKTQLMKCFEKPEELKTLFSFEIEIVNHNEETYLVDKKTGEIIGSNEKKIVKDTIEKQPLYRLWHIVYSIPEKDECIHTLEKEFKITKDTAEKLTKLDFTKAGFGNKSAKAMRKILPYLIEGYCYSDACSFAGYNHSDSMTKEENTTRILLDKLPNLSKNSLRQPIVEKILNQMINLVNSVVDHYGKPDEIRVELARELKQSRDERNDTFANLNKRERENQNIAKLLGEYGIRATRNNIIKWRLFFEINEEESKSNAVCIYCGKPFGLTAALKGDEVDVEHIIPKSKLFDDSQSNKTLSHRSCNETKGDRTAFDYMKSKSANEFEAYVERIESLYKKQIIGKSKRDKLLMPVEKIPQDFIERQLRETQYISRKSRELLLQLCSNVWATSGSVTSYLRRLWGWDDVLMNLQLPKYRELGNTEIIEYENKEQRHKKEIIKGWSKRDDHRHHAIDALVIACTQQGFVQRINTLSSQKTRDAMYSELGKQKYDDKKSLLENYIFNQKPFTTKQVEDYAQKILISFKSGKKVATISKHKASGKNLVSGIIVPRGALSEEFVYGKINTIISKPVKYLFENPDLIFKNRIKLLVKERLEKFEGDSKKALSSLKKEPVYLDNEKLVELTYGSCFNEEYVIKYPIEGFKLKDIESVVDSKIKSILKERFVKFDNKEKEALKDLDKNPVWFNEEKNIAIKTVRCFTGLSAVVPVKKDNDGKDIGYVKPGNNHHIAIYTDVNGKMFEHVCTFWHAVERKKYGIPVIIKDANTVWDKIASEPDCKYPESFLEKLPEPKLILKLSLQQNEMFLLGLNKDSINDAIQNADYSLISKYLYCVWSISENDYWFRHHLETQGSELKKSENGKESKRFYRLNSQKAFNELEPFKVKINCIGEIVDCKL